MDEDAKKRANLRVLQRLDSSVSDIIGSATHVVLYEFSDTKQHWEKRNVEGSLFITKRSGGAPRFKLVVLNRSSTENLEVPIGSNFQMQVREPYLIFRESSSQQHATIRGLWFHDDNERSSISALLQRVVNSQTHISDDQDPNQPAPTEQPQPPVPVPPPSPPKPIENNPTITTPSSSQKLQSISTPSSQKQLDAGELASALLSPLSLTTPQPPTSVSHEGASPQTTTPSSNNNNIPQQYQNFVLDKKSLQLSLLSLIQDERFLDLIHAQYLKVAHSRAKNKGKLGDSAGMSGDQDQEGMK